MIKPDCDEQPGFFLNLKFRECEKPLIEPVRARVSKPIFRLSPHGQVRER